MLTGLHDADGSETGGLSTAWLAFMPWPVPVKDACNAGFLIHDEYIILIDGVAKKATAPGSATREVTRYSVNAVALDLNKGGAKDLAFLLTRESGGAGTSTTPPP